MNKLSPLKSFPAADVKPAENYALENLFLNFKCIKKELVELMKEVLLLLVLPFSYERLMSLWQIVHI